MPVIRKPRALLPSQELGIGYGVESRAWTCSSCRKGEVAGILVLDEAVETLKEQGIEKSQRDCQLLDFNYFHFPPLPLF